MSSLIQYKKMFEEKEDEIKQLFEHAQSNQSITKQGDTYIIECQPANGKRKQAAIHLNPIT